MSVWSMLSAELKNAGRAAQGALDEGKVRLELFRIGQLCDKAARDLGYAVHRAHREGRTLEPELFARLADALSTHEDELKRLEADLAAQSAATSGAAPDSAPTPQSAGDPPAKGGPAS